MSTQKLLPKYLVSTQNEKTLWQTTLYYVVNEYIGNTMSDVNFQAVCDYLQTLQKTICRGLADSDGAQSFELDEWEKDKNAGLSGFGITSLIKDGAVYEKGGVISPASRARRCLPRPRPTVKESPAGPSRPAVSHW